jgi:peptidyl-prolyl cis-trans isomerase C
VNGRKITTVELASRVPRFASSGIAPSIGESRALEQLIEEEVLYLAALDEGIDEDEDVARRVDELRRQTLVQAYLDKKQEEITAVSEEEERRFYAEHPEDYTSEEARRVRMLVADEERICVRAAEMVEGTALPFAEACARFTRHPQLASARGLLPSWVRRDRAITWFGNYPRFHEVVFALEPGELSEPFLLGDQYAIAVVEEIREPRLRPFEEVRADIRGRLARERSAKGLPELLATLRKRYRVEVYEGEATSPDELFARAQTAGSPEERVKLYTELVESFPDHERSVESWFMLGFLRSEELGDRTGAAAAFEKVIELDADSELAQSARWMLTSGENEVPRFLEDAAAPGSKEDAP